MAEIIQVPKIQVLAHRDDRDEVNLYGFISDDGEVLTVHDDDGRICSMDVSNFLEFSEMVKEASRKHATEYARNQ